MAGEPAVQIAGVTGSIPVSGTVGFQGQITGTTALTNVQVNTTGQQIVSVSTGTVSLSGTVGASMVAGTGLAIAASTIAPAAMTRMSVSAAAAYAVTATSGYTIPTGEVLRLFGAQVVVVCTATGATNFVNVQILVTTSGVVVTTGAVVIGSLAVSVGSTGAMAVGNLSFGSGFDIQGTGVLGVAMSASSAGCSVAVNIAGGLYP